MKRYFCDKNKSNERNFNSGSSAAMSKDNLDNIKVNKEVSCVMNTSFWHKTTVTVYIQSNKPNYSGHEVICIRYFSHDLLASFGLLNAMYYKTKFKSYKTNNKFLAFDLCD